MAKTKNLTIQLNQELDSILAIGESRHKAKQDYAEKMQESGEKFNIAKSDKIHSVKTAQTYREAINTFSKWIKNEKPDVWKTKDLNSISKEVAYEYLRQREDHGLSAWTISRDMAGINKVLDLGLNKAEGNLKCRRLEDIQRSRGETNDSLSEGILAANKDQIIIAQATGIRRESVTNLEPKSFIFDKEGTPVAVRIEWERDGVMYHEKGGRFRIAPILKEYQRDVSQILKGKDPDKPIFESYSAKIDNHAFRADYAKKRYEELVQSKLILGEGLKNDFRGYDKSLLKEVSQNLGHNRERVVVEHYLKK